MWLMIAAVNISPHDGISKKIISQASALAEQGEKTLLGCLYGENPSLLSIDFNGEITVLEVMNNCKSIGRTSGYTYIRQCRSLILFIKNNEKILECNRLYIRHMLPSIGLLNFLRCSKRKKIKIVYEVPTFPYYLEQFNEAHNKFKTIIRLVIETIFWPFIYLFIDKLAIVRCRSNSLNLNKMIDIKNGISLSSIHDKKVHGLKELNTFNIIGVGTIYKYHGYDKIISAIKNNNGYVDNGKRKIVFYIVGESEEINRLRKMTNKLKLQNHVIFCGKKFGSELEEIYSKADFAVGTLKLSLRKANIDTAIKNIEYINHNLPIVTSGIIFDVKPKDFYMVVESDKQIKMDELYAFAQKYYSIDRRIAVSNIVQEFTWKRIMNSIKLSI